MSSKYGSLSSWFLEAVGEATGFFQWPIEYSESWRKKQLSNYKSKTYYETVRRLKNKGLIKTNYRQGRQFLSLTKKGELEKLFIKAQIVKPLKWDGKWRMIIFDIPEKVRHSRDQLRWLLTKNGYLKLQHSVFINPYPLNKEAISFLQESGLMSYIRILRIELMDNDKDLKKRFNLR